jgi:lipopolysaccharide transport system permease protein
MRAQRQEVNMTCEAPRGGLLREVWEYRYALHNLVLKDFRVRYRNMSLGMLWSVLNPLVMLAVLVVVFSYIHPNRTQHYFPIFLLLGLISFNFFSLCVSAATTCIKDNASLVKKVIFPRQLLPLAVLFSQTIHLLIQIALLFIFILWFKVPIRPSYGWLLLIFAVEWAAILGISLLCSALNVFYRDVQYVVESLLRVMFWFTPIFYALRTVRISLSNIHPALYYLFLMNPLAGCIDASRWAVLEGRAPDWHAFGFAAGVSLFWLVVGVWFFERTKGYFADKI